MFRLTFDGGSNETIRDPGRGVFVPDINPGKTRMALYYIIYIYIHSDLSTGTHLNPYLEFYWPDVAEIWHDCASPAPTAWPVAPFRLPALRGDLQLSKRHVP